jgi:hypothetical protein
MTQNIRKNPRDLEKRVDLTKDKLGAGSIVRVVDL